MKTLILVASILLSTSAFATMEASWQAHPGSKILGSSDIVNCPPYIYTDDGHGQLIEKVWTHEIKRHGDSAISSGECVYR